MRKLLLIVALLSLPALAAAGCGSREAASGAAELAPAGSVAYGEITLKPEGDQKQAIDSILSKFPGGEGSDKLRKLAEDAFQSSDSRLSFKDDIEPWLGDQAAFFVTAPAGLGQDPAAAGLIKADDEGKARDALEKFVEGKTEKHDYKDVEYLTGESTEAGAVFDGFLVIGTEAGVKAAIDTSKGGKKLSDDSDYEKAIADVPGDRLGFMYANMAEFLRSAQASGTPMVGPFAGLLGGKPFVATVRAEDDGLVVETSLPRGESLGAGFLGKASAVLKELPGDSWLALGQSDFGRQVSYFADLAAGFAGGRDALEQKFKAETGLDLQRDVIDWMGDYGIFVRGTRLSELEGALVIETSDEAASARFVKAARRLVREYASGEFPKPIQVFQRSGRVVIAYGDAAARDAVASGDRLGDSADFASARDSLGGDYDLGFYLLVKPILDLVDSTSAANDSGWQRARPYLEPLTALVSGTHEEGDTTRSAFKLVVK
jgi:hypothetical protein